MRQRAYIMIPEIKLTLL